MRLAIITLIVFFCSLTPHAAILPPGFIEVPLATGLDPTGMTQAPDGRIFIIEKYGAVRVVENGVLLPDPMVLLNVDNYNERGLSGITLHPDFASNGYIYLYYTLKNAGYNRLVRLKAIGNYADPLSEEVIFEGDPLFGTIHNGGAMSFGADGKLYLAVGDGAYGNNAPDMTSLLGKVIRLNDDGSIPADNPFYNTNTGKYRAIYASGLRNPFSLTIQPGTGKIFVCDVGSEFHEEVNQIEAGGFYGWNILEGKKDWQDLPSNYHDPVYTYSHAEGCAVVGAAFYNPPVTPFPQNFVGKFFFGDYCKNRIRVLNPTTGYIEQTFATQIDRPLVLLTGLDGSLYYISRGGTGGGSESDNTSSNEGMLWKISYVGAGAPVFSLLPQNTLVVAGEQAEFNAYANGTPPLEYQWEKNGVALLNEKGTTLSLASVSLADSGALFRCLVMNGYGQVSSPEAMLRVTSNQRPMPVITSPSPDYHYQAGVPFTFAGFATDLETGTLGPDDLTWRIDLHHDDHTHPGMPATPGIENGTFQLPTIGETADNVWIRILLSAKDQIGLTRTVYQDLFPQKSTIRVETNPAGIPIRIDGKTSTTPVESASVSGLRRVVDAPGFLPWATVFTSSETGRTGQLFRKSSVPQPILWLFSGVFTPP
ncbi:MAG: PQQ-dependent sugar dehydrogenase [Lewinellaceae bacterium]|nr:PQQ-dependent sugar dehydrogenase [Lewinellaceae bacterium]